MKFFKSLFGLKDKKKVKYEANTLAETNGTPDARTSEPTKTTIKTTATNLDKDKKTEKKADTTVTAETKATVTPTPVNNAAVSESKEINTVAKNIATEKSPKLSDTTSADTPKKPVDNVVSETKNTPKKVEAKAVNATKTAPEKAEVAPKTTTPKASTKTATATAKIEKKDTEITTAVAKKTSAPKPSVATKSAETKAAAVDTPAEEVTVSKSVRTGKFEIKKSKDGRFVFNLYASNNVIIATSQIYSSSTSAMNGIKSVIANAATAPIEDQSLKNVTTVPFPKWEIYLDKGEQYRFRLCASNGSCVCHSQGYTSKANCKKGIESIIKFASDAEITKAYLEKKDK